MKFDLNFTMFRANGTAIKFNKKEDGYKNSYRIFSRDCVNIHAVIKSQAICDPYGRRLIDFLKTMDARSPDAFLNLQNAILHLPRILAYSKAQVNGNS